LGKAYTYLRGLIRCMPTKPARHGTNRKSRKTRTKSEVTEVKEVTSVLESLSITPSPTDPTILLFSYGSNSFAQLSVRLGAPVVGDAALVVGMVRSFFGPRSMSWGGGVATLIPDPHGVAFGSVCAITQAQRQILDGYEGVDCTPPKYRLTPVPTRVIRDGTQVSMTAFSYLGNLEGYREHCLPSYAYLDACYVNIQSAFPRMAPRVVVVRVGSDVAPLGAYCPSVAREVKNRMVPVEVPLLLPPHRESLADVNPRGAGAL